MKIYTDTDFEFLLIDDIGVFDWKTNNMSKNNLVNELSSRQIDTINYYCYIPKDEDTFDVDIDIDKIKNIKTNDLMSNTINNSIPIKLSVSKLFKAINTLKLMKGSPISNALMDIDTNEENELLVISSTNKKLITIIINKIATWGIYPVDEITLTTKQSDKIIYKYYYKPDIDNSNSDEYDSDSDSDSDFDNDFF